MTINGAIHTISECTDSEATWELTNKWISHCAQEHPECSPNNRPQKWYPSRLLDVGAVSESDTARAMLKLHETKEQDTRGHYITVSHRWGNSSPMTLTQESVTTMRLGLLVIDLPKTFADVVKVAWKLGIQYVWIDSLCIFQDSEHEWRSESAKMGLIYKNSWLNIAAVDSPDCEGGCFYERDGNLAQPFRVNMKADQTEFLCIDSDLWRDNVDGALLSERGWVLQERLLSPRQLYLGQLQIYWECRRSTACEILPGGILPSMFAKPGEADSHKMKRFAATLAGACHDIRVPPTTSDKTPIRQLDRPLDIHSGWRHAVQSYSKCKLTYPRDKLIAISGVAKEMSKISNDQYLAGLWRSQLPATLLWSTEPDGGKSQYMRQRHQVKSEGLANRPRPLRAPTWSWASLDSAISFFTPATPRDGDRVVVDVLEAHVEPVAGDIHGEIMDGYLRLSCTLYPASLVYEDDMTTTTPSLQIGDSLFQHGVALDESTELIGSGQFLHCMPIFIRGWSGTQAGVIQVRALILQPSGEGQGHFERLGLFVNWGTRNLDVFREAWNEVEDLEYEEALGGGRYIITIT